MNALQQITEVLFLFPWERAFWGPSCQRVACGPEIAMSEGIFQTFTSPTESKINNDSHRTTAYGPEGLCGELWPFFGV